MDKTRSLTHLAIFASLLGLLATCGLAALRTAQQPALADGRTLEAALLALAAFCIVLGAGSRRARLLMPAAPVLVLAGLLHLWLAGAGLAGSQAVSAAIGGGAELLLGLALLPALLGVVAESPELRLTLRALQEREQRSAMVAESADRAIRDADDRAERMRRLAMLWQEHAHGLRVQLQRSEERRTELLDAVRPPDNVLVVPGAAHGSIRRYLLRLAGAFRWTRVETLPEAIRLAVGQGQIVFVDGLLDPLAECLFLQAVAETEMIGGGLATLEMRGAGPAADPAPAPGTTMVIERLVADGSDAGAALRTIRAPTERAATTLPSGQQAVA